MSVAYSQNSTLQRGDLNIFLTNSNGAPQNAYNITFALYYVDPNTSAEVLIGAVGRVPVNPAVGEYYASVQIPGASTPGDYRIRWDITEFAGSPTSQVVQEFAVIAPNSLNVGAQYTGGTAAMINSLRILLRDQNPDKWYKFRPPEHEGTLKSFNQVFGEIWEDDELHEYLQRSVDWWNMMPPATTTTLEEITTIRGGAWRTAILWGAIVHACAALSLNWVADEFSLCYHTLIYFTTRDGKVELDLPIGLMWDMLQGGGIAADDLHPEMQDALRVAYWAGDLCVIAADPLTGKIGLHPVTDLHRHAVKAAGKKCVRVTTHDAVVECTTDHSLFRYGGKNRIPAMHILEGGKVQVGTQLVGIDPCGPGGSFVLEGVLVEEVVEIKTPEFMYDLTVPGPQNFMLANGILAHNSYSIGGISLDLEKSSKYESAKQGAESNLEKAIEAKQQTVKFLRGLKQSRYGAGGMRSGLGPYVGAGINSPRNFIGVLLGCLISYQALLAHLPALLS